MKVTFFLYIHICNTRTHTPPQHTLQVERTPYLTESRIYLHVKVVTSERHTGCVNVYDYI